ncbi:unnamed protein product [Orchesella dallaii]|uniref:Uncharacterized protein n=1 Tax=Orchesella dallaii TaxID=48710 RepID=A0ABP1PSA2_9HEXA
MGSYLICITLLSNFYRGDNIKTAPIPKFLIDKFAQLVENDIEVFSMPEKLPNEERKQRNDHSISEYSRPRIRLDPVQDRSRPRSRPVQDYVSNLLYYLAVVHNIQFQIPVQTILKTKLSQTQQLRLNHSKLPKLKIWDEGDTREINMKATQIYDDDDTLEIIKVPVTIPTLRRTAFTEITPPKSTAGQTIASALFSPSINRRNN